MQRYYVAYKKNSEKYGWLKKIFGKNTTLPHGAKIRRRLSSPPGFFAGIIEVEEEEQIRTLLPSISVFPIKRLSGAVALKGIVLFKKRGNRNFVLKFLNLGQEEWEPDIIEMIDMAQERLSGKYKDEVKSVFVQGIYAVNPRGELSAIS